jgi:glyoxylase-like metal-dependent hydrolase (beta-lactamase superfamily II)
MKRGFVLAALLVTGALSLSVAGFQQGADKPKVVTVDKIKDNLFVLKGGGGNTAVFVTTNGVVVVDTKIAGWGPPILAKIKELTPKPITTVINTHSHFDHVSGNVDFPANVEIVAHENTKTNIEAWPSVYGIQQTFPNVVKESGGKGVPKRTYKDTLTLGSGNDRVELRYFGRGHTSGDSFVIFPALGVMHTGDMFPAKNLPIMDKNAGGSGVDYPETLIKAYNGVKGVNTLITGHNNDTLPFDDLKLYSEFVREFVNTASEAKKAGRTPDDVAASWKTPAKYTGFAAAQAAGVKSAAEVVFGEVK